MLDSYPISASDAAIRAIVNASDADYLQLCEIFHRADLASVWLLEPRISVRTGAVADISAAATKAQLAAFPRLPKVAQKRRRVAKVGVDGRRKLTPPELARRWGVDPEKIRRWIRSGELRAINVAARAGGRQRFLVDEDAVLEFEARRNAATTQPARSARKRVSADVISFF